MSTLATWRFYTHFFVWMDAFYVQTTLLELVLVANRASKAETTLRFKVAFRLVCKRGYVRLRSNFVMCFWWGICFPGVEFKVITCDQTPVWMNSSAEKEDRWTERSRLCSSCRGFLCVEGALQPLLC